jgi:hypothetical protein
MASLLPALSNGNETDLAAPKRYLANIVSVEMFSAFL